MQNLDSTDRAILRHLQRDGRMTNAALAERVGLSASACLRRVKLLEKRKAIRGYAAIVGAADGAEGIVVVVQVTLERQTEAAFDRFEAAVRANPEIRECLLMTGDFDYALRVEADDAAHYEAIHKETLSRLPGVQRVRSSFAIKTVVSRR